MSEPTPTTKHDTFDANWCVANALKRKLEIQPTKYEQDEKK